MRGPATSSELSSESDAAFVGSESAPAAERARSTDNTAAQYTQTMTCTVTTTTAFAFCSTGLSFHEIAAG